jgi:hypothetical protein
MQLWFARGSEVSIREQLVTQVVLGILGDDLAPGQRLPSTRELARRFTCIPTQSVRGTGNWHGIAGLSTGGGAEFLCGRASRTYLPRPRSRSIR